MSIQSDLQQQIADAAAQIALWNAALLSDAPDPQPDEATDGSNVGSVAWRQGLLDNIAAARAGMIEAQKTLNLLSPYFISTRQVLR